MVSPMSRLSRVLSCFRLGIANLRSLISPEYSELQSYSRGGCPSRLYAPALYAPALYAAAATMTRMAIILGCFPPDQLAYCAAEINQHALYSKKYSTTLNLVVQGSSVVVSDKRYQLLVRYRHRASLFFFPSLGNR
jgi:hypothetical protein